MKDRTPFPSYDTYDRYGSLKKSGLMRYAARLTAMLSNFCSRPCQSGHLGFLGKYSMSKLSALIAQAKAGLSIQESIPEARWAAIAKQCGGDEIAEIRARIEALKTELASVEEWDGDTQDEINMAIFRFSQLLNLASI